MDSAAGLTASAAARLDAAPVELAIQPTRPPRRIPTTQPPTTAPTLTPFTPPAYTPRGTLAPTFALPTGGVSVLSTRPPLNLNIIVTVDGADETTPYPPPQPAPGDLLIGYSVEGRPIFARRFGMGERAVVLVGGMHGGWEANTVALVDALGAHFATHMSEIPANITLYLIPAANPDGLPYGRTAEGRFNARGVDLNRNWGCGWQADAFWRDQPVDPGAAPFSEPETAALAAFIQQVQPAAALFYHSAADGIFAGNCRRGGREADSVLMAAVYGEAAGYSYDEPFTAYPVTGTAAAWADGEGIAAADVELESWSDTEFDVNLAGVLALLRWVSSRSN